MANVIIRNGALEDSENGSIVLRGNIAFESLGNLNVDDYQREPQERPSLMKAILSGQRLPDIECGMRGQNFESHGDQFTLRSPVFIIDGQQRVHNLKLAIEKAGLPPLPIGTLVHFDTTPKWERERFNILNTQRTRVSVNLILYN